MSDSNETTTVQSQQENNSFNFAVLKGNEPNVKAVDSDENNNLTLWCYTKCDNESNNDLKQCRGVVFQDKELVMRAMPYTDEYNDTQRKELKNIISDVSQCYFYPSYEGTLLRLFNYNEKWYTTTHRKLDACKSRWSSKESFGNMFETAIMGEEKYKDIKEFYNSLDKSLQYMFLVLNTKDNRVVCVSSSEPKLFHVGTYKQGVLDTEHSIGLSKPQRLFFENVDSLCDFVLRTDPKYKQGVIVFMKNNRQLKVLNQDYQHLFKARGNEQSIKFRYLQVRMNPEYSKMLFYLYPDKRPLFEDYENILYNIATTLYNNYVRRYIRREYLSVPENEFNVLKECHKWHVEDRSNNRVNKEKVIEVLNKQPPVNLNNMIKKYKLDQKNKNNYMNNVNMEVKGIYTPSPVITQKETKPVSPLLLPKRLINKQTSEQA